MTQHLGRDTTSLSEIHDVNLNSLLLAQQLLRDDFECGLYRTGLSHDTGKVLMGLTVQQTMSLASSNVMLFGFRLNDAALLSALNKTSLTSSLGQARTAMALAQAPLMKQHDVVL